MRRSGICGRLGRIFLCAGLSGFDSVMLLSILMHMKNDLFNIAPPCRLSLKGRIAG